MNIIDEKIKGLVFGSAFGDAWGYVTEFMKYPNIMEQNIEPPQELVISDDTQMSIYNFYAMQEIMEQGYNWNLLPHNIDIQNSIRKTFAEFHIDFYNDKMNNRAPGGTCMSALKKYYETTNKVTGREGALHNNSKGCGTIMRSPWMGAFPIPRETIALLSIIQSQTTHDHPTSWVAAAVAALITHDTLHNINTDLPYIEKSLKIIDEIAKIDSELIEDSDLGLIELRKGLLNIQEKFESFTMFDNGISDVNDFFGQGWIAEETLYNAVGVCDMYGSKRPYYAIKRLVRTNGDSDSVASVGGAFLGAEKGYSMLDHRIEEHLEKPYAAELRFIVKELININS